MTTVYKYRYKCVEDIDYVYAWGEVPPTVCLDHPDHTIDTSSIAIVEINNPNELSIKEETVPTGGFFQSTTLVINANANCVSTAKIIWPFNISALAVNFITTSDNQGDIAEMYAGKNTVIGAIAAPVVPAGDWVSQNYINGNVVLYTHPIYGSRVYTCIANTVGNANPTSAAYWKHGFPITVTSTVLDYAFKGRYINLYSGANCCYVDRVLSVDKEKNKIFVETNPTYTFSPLSPTYVRMTVYFVKNYEIGPPGRYEIGKAKVGGASVPENTFIEVSYNNKSLTVDKKLVGSVEILY